LKKWKCHRGAKGVTAHGGLRGRTTRADWVYTEYCHSKRTEWFVKIQPALKKAKLKILVRLCKNKLLRREIIELRAGRSQRRRRLRNYSNQC
jgi:hypothetical protein